MTKEQWLNQTIMFDKWGRPPSMADVPLTCGPRKKALKTRGLSEEEIDTYFKEYLKEKDEITQTK